MKLIWKILGAIVGLFLLVVIGGLIYLNVAFPNVEPAPNLRVESTPERIARGEYLANHVAICMDCHSLRDFTKFAAPVKKGTEGGGGELFGENLGFPGNIYSKNITPDKETGLGNWNDGEIIRAITVGVNKDGDALFPLMPYQNFKSLTQEDLYSIISYIKSVHPIKNAVPERELNFPLNLIVNTIPEGGYKPHNNVDKNNKIEYGKYLVTIASCNECHTPAKEGEPLPGLEFAGGMEFNWPSFTLRSANITPDKETGIGNWTVDDFIKRFKANLPDSSEAVSVPEGEFNTIMPWRFYADMTTEDLTAIFEYLRTLKPISHQVVKYEPHKKK